MSFMNPPNPTQLHDLCNRGGKIMIYHGGAAAGFARVFSVPGMAHCSGGPATDQFDMLTPLVLWVERGVAPDNVVAFARGAGNPGGANTEVPSTWAANRSSPLCPFPQVARYRCTGSVEEAASLVCQ
jgi:hypothetical protein